MSGVRQSGKEHAMSPSAITRSFDIRRNPDGSIDFDHYRRAAARERQQTLRQAFEPCAGALGRLAALIIARSIRIVASSRMLVR